MFDISIVFLIETNSKTFWELSLIILNINTNNAENNKHIIL